MTTNERLFVAGLLEAFDQATRTRNKDEMVAILERVEISPADAVTIATAVLADPKRYGP